MGRVDVCVEIGGHQKREEASSPEGIFKGTEETRGEEVAHEKISPPHLREEVIPNAMGHSPLLGQSDKHSLWTTKMENWK